MGWWSDWWDSVNEPGARDRARQEREAAGMTPKLWPWESSMKSSKGVVYDYSNNTKTTPYDPVLTKEDEEPTKGPTPTGPRQNTGPSAADIARAEAAAARRRAGERFTSQAGNLDPQIAALKHALDVAFKQNLDQNLDDIGQLIKEQADMLKSNASNRAINFLDAARNTDAATASQAEESISNLVRERQDTMTAVLQLGAGQTDALKALVSAARNWRANVQEGNRAYFDSMQSINQSITDLNQDTQSALGNVYTQGESERERLWQEYYNRRSESYTNLGNLYQQQANYLDQAKEMEVGAGGGDKKSSSGDAFMKASEEAGKSYKREALPDWVSNYQGQAKVDARVQNTNLASAPKFEAPKRARGASLRSWAA